jgi:hypothetical protein
MKRRIPDVEQVYLENYATREYGVTPKQWNAFVQKANKELDADRKAHRLKPFIGKLKRG